MISAVGPIHGFHAKGKCNLAVSPPVEVKIKAFPYKRNRKKRVLVRALDFGESFWMNPEEPDYTIHSYLQGAINSLHIPKKI
jgi:D-glycero-alpha-D-manno-heptose-7-phosphate kinase